MRNCGIDIGSIVFNETSLVILGLYIQDNSYLREFIVILNLGVTGSLAVVLSETVLRNRVGVSSLVLGSMAKGLLLSLVRPEKSSTLNLGLPAKIDLRKFREEG